MLNFFVKSYLANETAYRKCLELSTAEKKYSSIDDENLTLQESSTDSLHYTDLDNLVLFLLDKIEGE